MANQAKTDKQRLIDALKDSGDRDLQAILADYNNGFASIQDATIRTIQQANSIREIAMFDATNEKREGIYSLSKGQLDKGIAFYCTGIALMAYQVVSDVNGVPTPTTLNPRTAEEYAAMMNTDSFGGVADIPALANGAFEDPHQPQARALEAQHEGIR